MKKETFDYEAVRAALAAAMARFGMKCGSHDFDDLLQDACVYLLERPSLTAYQAACDVLSREHKRLVRAGRRAGEAA